MWKVFDADSLILRALPATKGWAVGVPDEESLARCYWSRQGCSC